MPRRPVVTLHIMPVPIRDVVTVMVFESGHRVSGGMFEVSAAAWERVRRCLTPGLGLRIQTIRRIRGDRPSVEDRLNP
jgi:hypothetical protein